MELHDSVVHQPVETETDPPPTAPPAPEGYEETPAVSLVIPETVHDGENSVHEGRTSTGVSPQDSLQSAPPVAMAAPVPRFLGWIQV
jgi:hypothetical protein